MVSELRDLWKDNICGPGKHMTTWLFWCWDGGLPKMDLVGSEARQLGSFSRESANYKATGKVFHPMMATLVSYEGKEGLVFKPGKLSAMEKGIQDMRELAVVEMKYGIHFSEFWKTTVKLEVFSSEKQKW